METRIGSGRGSVSAGDFLSAHVFCPYREIFHGEFYGLAGGRFFCGGDSLCHVAYVQRAEQEIYE